VSVVESDPRAEPLVGPWLFFVDVPTPASGANVAWQVGGSPVVAIVAARAHFVADANVANRQVALDYIARSVTYVRNQAAQVYVASSDTLLEWHANQTMSEFAANSPTIIPVLDVPLSQGVTVQFTVDSIQAGDQLSALRLTVLRWAPGEQAPAHFRRR
jgi:hypothetical protein